MIRSPTMASAHATSIDARASDPPSARRKSPISPTPEGVPSTTYPHGDDVGRSFDLSITAFGDRLDIEVIPTPELPMSGVDIKWHNPSGGIGFCRRTISAMSRRVNGGGGVFTSTIDDLLPGRRQTRRRGVARRLQHVDAGIQQPGTGVRPEQRQPVHPSGFQAWVAKYNGACQHASKQ